MHACILYTVYKHLVKFKITVCKMTCLQFQNHVQYIATHYAYIFAMVVCYAKWSLQVCSCKRFNNGLLQNMTLLNSPWENTCKI